MDKKILATELISELQQMVAKYGDLPVYVMADDYGWCSGTSFLKDAGKPYRNDVSTAIVIEAHP